MRQTFVRALKARLTAALAQFNHVLPHLSHLRIIRPKHKPERGLWALTKLEPQPEPHSLGPIKDAINQRYGILDKPRQNILYTSAEINRLYPAPEYPRA